MFVVCIGVSVPMGVGNRHVYVIVSVTFGEVNRKSDRHEHDGGKEETSDRFS